MRACIEVDEELMKFKVGVLMLLGFAVVPLALSLSGCASSEGGKEKEIQVSPEVARSPQTNPSQLQAMQQAARATAEMQRKANK
jgi:hypothetical protein